MKLLLLGGPGAGKGTQAQMLAKQLNIPHISTGEIFRDNIRRATELGSRVKDILTGGGLVPDKLTNEIVRDRLLQDDCVNGYILDGYPRTLCQADFLDEFLSGRDQELDLVINIESSDECIIERLSKRRSCGSCGQIYHLGNTPPEDYGICDSCGEELIQRADDREETVRDRLRIYHDQTKPLIEYYTGKGKLVNIDGERRIQPIFDDILNIIGVK